MTNGETIFVVAFTMVLLLGPFAFIIFSLLKHSKETYSVLYTPRTFKTSAIEYFFSLDIFFGSFLAIMGILMLSSMIGIKISVTQAPHWFVYATLYCTILMMFVGSAYILWLSINYWKYSKNTMIAFDPGTKSIEINTSSQEYSIYEGDIENIEIFTNDNYKLFFAYYRFKLKNGEELILTSKTKGVFGIFEFFKKIPTVQNIKRFPIIR